MFWVTKSLFHSRVRPKKLLSNFQVPGATGGGEKWFTIFLNIEDPDGRNIEYIKKFIQNDRTIFESWKVFCETDRNLNLGEENSQCFWNLTRVAFQRCSACWNPVSSREMRTILNPLDLKIWLHSKAKWMINEVCCIPYKNNFSRISLIFASPYDKESWKITKL